MGACEECEHCKRKDCQWDYMYADEETAIDCMDFWRVGTELTTLSDVVHADHA